MRLRRRRPEQPDEHFDEQAREAEQHDFDDARHFAGRSREGDGLSDFARRGQSHEERMRDDDSRQRFGEGHRREPPREEPGGARYDARPYGEGGGHDGWREPVRGPRRTEERAGYYGSGGSYGYGGGFEHPRERRPERGERIQNAYRSEGDLGSGNEEFYEATGGFGRDVSAYGRHGFGYPGRGENRYGAPGGGVHHDARGYFNEQANRPMPGRGYFNEDARQGFTQHGGYSQSGGERPEAGRGGSGYGRSIEHSDARGHEGGGRGSQQGPRLREQQRPSAPRLPKGYTRSDERIHEDLCDRLAHGEADPSEVTVTVAAGVVTLEGFVASRGEKFAVEELAASIAGVKDVENRLRVQRPGGEARSEGSNGPMKSMQPESESASKPAGTTGSSGTNGLRG